MSAEKQPSTWIDEEVFLLIEIWAGEKVGQKIKFSEDAFFLLQTASSGSAIARIVGSNTATSPYFEEAVNMYCYEEYIDGKRLTEIINTQHENVKYLPGHKLPDNIIAVPDAKDAAIDADILIFVVPHQFVTAVCAQMKAAVKKDAMAISLIKVYSSCCYIHKPDPHCTS
eukprot:gene3846-4382_t